MSDYIYYESIKAKTASYDRITIQNPGGFSFSRIHPNVVTQAMVSSLDTLHIMSATSSQRRMFMRYVLAILMVLFTFTSALSEPMATVPKSYLKDVKVKLEKLRAIEDATPTVSIKGLEVVQDSKNRVFIKDTAAVEIKLAMLEYADDISIKGKVKQYFVPQKGAFVSRFGMMAAYDFDIQEKSLLKNSLYISYDAFRYKKIGLGLVAGTQRAGFGIFHKLTPNTKLMVGSSWRYNQAIKSNTSGFLGIGFNF